MSDVEFEEEKRIKVKNRLFLPTNLKRKRVQKMREYKKKVNGKIDENFVSFSAANPRKRKWDEMNENGWNSQMDGIAGKVSFVQFRKYVMGTKQTFICRLEKSLNMDHDIIRQYLNIMKNEGVLDKRGLRFFMKNKKFKQN